MVKLVKPDGQIPAAVLAEAGIKDQQPDTVEEVVQTQTVPDNANKDTTPAKTSVEPGKGNSRKRNGTTQRPKKTENSEKPAEDPLTLKSYKLEQSILDKINKTTVKLTTERGKAVTATDALRTMINHYAETQL